MIRLRSVRAATIALVALVALASAGCAESDRSRAASSGPPLKMTAAYSREVMSALPIVAAKKGFFEGEGLDVELRPLESSKYAADALVAGTADAAFAADTPVVFASLSGAKFKIVASVGDSDRELYLMARTDRGILRPPDVRGKRVGVFKGTAAHFFMHAFLVSNGLTEDDVTVVYGDFGEITTMIERGEIDAAAAREPFIGEARDALGDKLVVFEAPGVYTKSMTLLVATDTDERVIERMLRALLKAQVWVDGHPDEAARIVAADIGRPVEETLAGMERCDLSVELDQALIVDLESQGRWALRSGLATATAVPDYLDLVHEEYLERIEPTAVTVIK